MSDLFYSFIRLSWNHPFQLSRKATIMGIENTHSKGAFLIAPNHNSHYDIPLLISHSKRRLDFLSITEIFKRPVIGRFFHHMNAFALDRSRPDARTVRIVLERLKKQRVVCMFPEGNLRCSQQSILYSGQMKPGLGRIGMLSQSPVIPCVIENSQAYRHFKSWLPLKRTRYGIIFGDPMTPPPKSNDSNADKQSAREFEQRYIQTMQSLHRQLLAAMHEQDGYQPAHPSDLTTNTVPTHDDTHTTPS